MSRAPNVAAQLDRTGRIRPVHLLAYVLGATLLACADPAAPEAFEPDGPRMIKEVEGRPQLLNFQLRAVEDPNIIDDPNLSQAYGHLQLKLTVLADGSVRVAFKGQIQNPGGERFTGFTLATAAGGRGSELVSIGEVEGRTGRHILIDPEDATISAEVAARLYGTPDTIEDPNILVATFYTDRHPAGAIQGTHALLAAR
jgi:hypothetical protein